MAGALAGGEVGVLLGLLELVLGLLELFASESPRAAYRPGLHFAGPAGAYLGLLEVIFQSGVPVRSELRILLSLQSYLQVLLSLFEPRLQSSSLAGGEIYVLLGLPELILGLFELRFQVGALIGSEFRILLSLLG